MKYSEQDIIDAYKNVSTVRKQDNKLAITWQNNDEGFKGFILDLLNQLCDTQDENYSDRVHTLLYEIKMRSLDIQDQDCGDGDYVNSISREIEEITTELIEIVQSTRG